MPETTTKNGAMFGKAIRVRTITFINIKGSKIMSGCQCDPQVVPDYTKVGFNGESSNALQSSVKTTNTIESVQNQLSSTNVQALSLSACVGASYRNGDVCFDFPVFGNVCVNVPIGIPANANLRVCGDVCTTWGIPTGLKITLYVNDQALWSGTVVGSC